MNRIGAVKSLPLAALIVAVAITPGAALSAGDRALGQHLSSECVTCHQLSGRFEGIPPIVGWPEESFVEIMNEYREKKRPNPVMQTIAGRLSADEVAALAAYFGSLKPPEQRKTKGGKS
jgi:cytochrome c